MKLKKTLLSSLAICGTALATTTIITSCSSVNKELVDDIIPHGDGTKISTNVSLESSIKNAMKSTDGVNAYKEQIAYNILNK